MQTPAFAYPALNLPDTLDTDQLVVTKYPHLSYSQYGERPDVIPASSLFHAFLLAPNSARPVCRHPSVPKNS